MTAAIEAFGLGSAPLTAAAITAAVEALTVFLSGIVGLQLIADQVNASALTEDQVAMSGLTDDQIH